MVVVVWLFLVICVGVHARSRGRSFLGWALLAFIISPILAWILLLVLRNCKLQIAAVVAPIQVVVNNVVNNDKA